MRKAFKYRIEPTKAQIGELETDLETLRRLYNECLGQRKIAYESQKLSVKRYDQQRWFTDARKSNTWYERLNRTTATAAQIHLDLAFKAFFRRVMEYKAAIARGENPKVKPGYPRFKGKNRYNSIEFTTYPNGVRLKEDRLYVQNVGHIKVRLHRPVEGTIKTVTLKREAGKWYVIFSCELPDVEIRPSANPPVGIDLGLSSFITLSDPNPPEPLRQHEPNPRYLKTVLPALVRVSRASTVKDKMKHPKKRQYTERNSKRHRKAVKRLQKLHAKVKNQRKEHHHQLARKLVRSYGLIAVEALDIRGMLENRGIYGSSREHRFARSISDAAWGGFVSTLKSKAASAGVSIVTVDPRGTTQGCSGCGRVVPKTIRDRWHECPHCGLSLDRDENAARNILTRGLLARTEPAGVNPGITPDSPRNLPTFPDLTDHATPIKNRSDVSAATAAGLPEVITHLTLRQAFLPLGCLTEGKTVHDKENRRLSPRPTSRCVNPERRSLKKDSQKTFW